MVRRALFGPWAEPSLGLVYGSPDDGKTTDMAYSFAGAGAFFTPRGALKGAQVIAGLDLHGNGGGVWSEKRAIEVDDLIHATKLISQVAAKKSARYQFIVVDDISILLRKTYRRLKAKMSGSDKRNGYKLWEDVGAALQGFADAADASGIHCWATAHEIGPETDEATGRSYRGGPMMPSKALRALLPYLFDEVWRTGKDAEREGLWKGIFRADELDREWLTKSRHNLVRGSAPTPQNTAELLRSVGFDVPRIAGPGAWMEKACALTARLIGEGEPVAEVCAKVGTALYRRGYPVPLIRWAVHRDGVDRALLARRRTDELALLGIVP